jgi:UDP-2,4-diacetamido-2,4,6-trideoxy-beta-L-altropyranose hydrolase
VTRSPLIIRADANPAIGSGHVMRCLALAESAWTRGFQSIFVRSGDSRVDREIESRGFDIIRLTASPYGTRDAMFVQGLSRALDAAAIVVDGYAFPSEYYALLRSSSACVVAIHDLAGHDFPVDVLVNPSLAGGSQYDEPTTTLVGPRYALLRSEFLAHPRASRGKVAGVVQQLLVSFGGSDPSGSTGRVLALLPARSSMVVRVVLGPDFPWRDELSRAVRHAVTAGHTVELWDCVRDVASAMVGCDAAVVSASSTLAELAYLGCPSAAYSVAENQEPLAAALKHLNCIFGGSSLSSLTDECLASQLDEFVTDNVNRTRLTSEISPLVDGLGAARVCEAIARCIRGSVRQSQPMSRSTN